jgi:tripartite tricarboxylate transporter family receptor
LFNLLLQSALGIKVAEVAYRGTAPAINDLVAGQIDFPFDQTLGGIPQMQAGTIKAFAVTSGSRLDHADQIQLGHQSQGCTSDRPRCSVETARSRRRGDRLTDSILSALEQCTKEGLL